MKKKVTGGRRPFALVSFLATLAAACVLPLQAEERTPPRRVLVILPYTHEYPSSVQFLAGLREGLSSDATRDVELIYEHLDLARFGSLPDYFSDTADYFRRKYRAYRPDAVVTTSVLDGFLYRYGREAFPGSPIVLALTETTTVEKRPEGVFALYGPYEYGRSIDFIGQTLPETKRIYLVTGSSEVDRAGAAELRRLAENWKGRYEFEYVEALGLEETLERVRNAPPDSAVLFCWYFNDPEGNPYVPTEVARLIVEASPAPVFGTQRSYLGSGIVGGYLWNIQTFAKNVAIQSLQLMDRADYPLQSYRMIDAGEYCVDWKTLSRWGIRVEDLPAGTFVANKTAPVLDWYGVFLIIVALLAVCLALAVTVMLFVRASKKRIEREHDVLKVRLSLALKEGAELNRRLDSRALRDPLTGLYNRKYVDERIEDEFQRYARTRSEFSIIQVDVDSFHTVNQRFGYETGNILLSRIAGELTKLVRLYDVLGRWNGEEFLVLLPDTDEESAAGFAERIRKAVSGAVYFQQEHKLVVTISCGVASSGQAESVAHMVRNAGLALANAQQRGRNRVVRYSSLVNPD